MRGAVLLCKDIKGCAEGRGMHKWLGSLDSISPLWRDATRLWFTRAGGNKG